MFQLLPVRNELKEYQLTYDQKEKFFVEVKEARQIYSKDILFVGFHGSFSPKLSKKSIVASNAKEFCPAGKKLFVIETNNNLYPCPFLTQDQFRIGSFVNGQLRIEKNFPNDGEMCLAEKLLKGEFE